VLHDEAWHHYEGSPLELFTASPDGRALNRQVPGPQSGAHAPIARAEVDFLRSVGEHNMYKPGIIGNPRGRPTGRHRGRTQAFVLRDTLFSAKPGAKNGGTCVRTARDSLFLLLLTMRRPFGALPGGRSKQSQMVAL
jgi:hypothetical protein